MAAYILTCNIESSEAVSQFAVSQNSDCDSKENILTHETKLPQEGLGRNTSLVTCRKAEVRLLLSNPKHMPRTNVQTDLAKPSDRVHLRGGRCEICGGRYPTIVHHIMSVTAACSEDNYMLVIDSQQALAVNITPSIPLVRANEEIR